MEKHILDKIIDEIWGKKSSVFVILAIFLMFGGIASSTIYSQMKDVDGSIDNTEMIFTDLGRVVLSSIWIGLLILFIWYLLFVFNCNHIRGAKKGKTGIIVYYDCESKSIYRNTVRRLGEEFRAKIQDNFDIIDVPYGVEKSKVNDKKKAKEKCTTNMEI